MLRPDRAVVISLARQPERREAFLARWAATGTDLGIEVFEAADRPGDPARGCWESHLAVLRAAGSTAGSLAVFEDDAVLAPGVDPAALPEPPPDWWLLRIGADGPAPPPPSPISMVALAIGGIPLSAYGVWRNVFPMIHRTHAYCVREPRALATGVSARRTRDISVALSSNWPGHYRAWPSLATQASDPEEVAPLP